MRPKKDEEYTSMEDIGWRFGRSDRWILAREKSESTLWMGRDDG